MNETTPVSAMMIRVMGIEAMVRVNLLVGRGIVASRTPRCRYAALTPGR